MSLEEQLRNRLQKGLNATQTRHTDSTGKVSIYEKQGQVVSKNVPEMIKSYGFVVDTKPDLTVGEVRPFLLISSQDVPTELSILKSYNVTHIMSLLPDFSLPVQITMFIKEHKCLHIYDEETFSLIKCGVICELANIALDYIEKVKKENGRLLLHCNAGISRAPSIAILYLMISEKLSFDLAFEIVKQARGHIKPNDGFVKQLKSVVIK